jgi:hypothetical protein
MDWQTALEHVPVRIAPCQIPYMQLGVVVKILGVPGLGLGLGM